MENVTALLQPDQEQMQEHLGLLFSRALTGRIEITAIKVTADGERAAPRTRFFDVEDLREAAEWAAAVNSEHMWNVYVGAAARVTDVFPGKAATDEDFYQAFAIHADVDDVHNLASVRERYRSLGITPPFIVVTGRTPTTRAQLWWPLEDPVRDPDVYRRTLRAVAQGLDTDPAVTAAKQLMRLGGGINWPKKAGRILEKTEIITPNDAQMSFSIEQIQRAFPVQERTSQVASLKALVTPEHASQRDRFAMTYTDGGWHQGALAFTASLVQQGVPPDVILSLAPAFQRNGYSLAETEAELRVMISGAVRKFSPPPQESFDPVTGEVIEAEPERPPSRPFRASDLAGDPPVRQWIVPDWIVEGAVNSLYGDGGVGKTLLAQQLACAVSVGQPWLGMETKQGSVLAVLCEDEKDELHRRHNHIKAALGHTVGNPFRDVWLWPRVGDENTLVRWDRDGKATLGDFYLAVATMVEELAPSLLILDTLADVYGGNEIDRPQVNYFVKTVLGGLIKRRSEAGRPLTVLLLGHPSVAGKASGSGYSGSTAWNNAVRSRMYLTRPEEGASDERILIRGKANYASSGDETAVRLFFSDGVLHAQDDAEDGDSLLWAARRDVVEMIDRAWLSGRPYSAQKGHSRDIYALLPGEMAKAGYGPQIIRQAVRECIADGEISVSASNGKRGYRGAK